MAFLETGDFCSFDEYQQYRAQRIKETDLVKDELYTYMMQLTGESHQAAMQAVRVERFIKHAGFVAVKFVFLDEDLQRDHSAVETMHNGYIDTGSGVFECADSEEQFEVVEAYLRDYDEGEYAPSHMESMKLSVYGVVTGN